MSKSEWKELPDWTDLDDYAFMGGASRKGWAWEFLRRIAGYRKDFDDYSAMVGKAKADAGDNWKVSSFAMCYVPPKLDASESDHSWAGRAALADGPDPITIPIHVFFPKKWGLVEMSPYDQQFSKAVRFIKDDSEFPRFIREIEDFYSATCSPKSDSNGYAPSIIPVRPDRAVVEFDLTAPLGPQKKRLKGLLKAHYKNMRKIERLTRSTIPKSETGHLIRHLRVLDAKRVDPNISNADLAAGLGYIAGEEDEEMSAEEFDKALGKKTSSQQGNRWAAQAKEAQAAYRNFLIRPSSTSKKA